MERAGLATLPEADRAIWTRVLGVYADRLVAADPLRDRRLVALRDALAAIDCPSGAAPLDAPGTEIRAALTDAMPVYQRHWWPRHHATNVAWIAALAGQLQRYETPLAAALARAYGGRWPEDRVRADVTAYASHTGAYTTNEPKPDHDHEYPPHSRRAEWARGAVP